MYIVTVTALAANLYSLSFNKAFMRSQLETMVSIKKAISGDSSGISYFNSSTDSCMLES